MFDQRILRAARWTAGLLAAVATAGFLAPSAGAADVCENINGNTIVVGEARYETLSGTDSAYANSYWGTDPDQELANGRWNSDYIGAVNIDATNLGFFAYGYHQDSTASDYTTVTFSLLLERSEGGSGACPTVVAVSTEDTLVINSSVSANLFYAGKLFGRSGMSFLIPPDYYALFWRATVSVSGDLNERDEDSDSGCFIVATSSICTLQDY